MNFLGEEDVVFLHLVKHFGMDGTNISRVITDGISINYVVLLEFYFELL